jgi:cold shock protein
MAEHELALCSLRDCIGFERRLEMGTTETDKLVNIEGTVKWFDPKKGFGFIVGPEGQDIFTHYSKITGEGFRVLKDGSRVSYDAERTDKGWHASRVARLDPEENTPAVHNGARQPQHAPSHSRSPRR